MEKSAPILRSEDLDVVGDLFGIRFIGPKGNETVELYIEDDESYYLRTKFNVLWLPDLESVVSRARLRSRGNPKNGEGEFDE